MRTERLLYVALAFAFAGVGCSESSVDGGLDLMTPAITPDLSLMPSDLATISYDLALDDAGSGGDMATLSWVIEQSGVNTDLPGAWGSGPLDVYVVGSDGVILHSSDGATWQMQQSGAMATFEGVAGTDSHNVYAVLVSGGIRHTTDGGKTWNAEVAPNFNSGANVAALGTDVFVVGDFNSVFHNTTAMPGSQWQPISPAGNASLYGLMPMVDGRLFVAGTGSVDANGVASTIMVTSNLGQTWTRQSVKPIVPSTVFWKIWAATAMELYAVGNNGTIVHTLDGGQTWVQQVTNTTLGIASIWGSSPYDVYAGGGAKPGFLLHTSDHGNTWNPVALPALPAEIGFGSIWGTSATNVYAVGSQGIILHLK